MVFSELRVDVKLRTTKGWLEEIKCYIKGVPYTFFFLAYILIS